jgi:hypothetical protein
VESGHRGIELEWIDSDGDKGVLAAIFFASF